MVSVFFSQWYSPILLVLISLLACTVSQLNANVHLKSKHSLNLFELDWERLPLEIFLPPESSISTSHDGFDGEGGQNEETNIESFFDFSSFASIFSSSSVSSSFQNSNNSNNKGSSYDTISNFINDFSSFASSMFSSNPNYSRNTFKSSTSLLRSPKSRKLQTKGSNCILIERGTVPRYYDCNGCVIDRAQACIDDLRGNKSHNVYPDCHFKAASVRYLGSCCPKVELINERYSFCDLFVSECSHCSGSFQRSISFTISHILDDFSSTLTVSNVIINHHTLLYL